MEQLTALAIVVSVMAQAITLLVLHRTIRNQATRADVDHARRLEIDHNDRLRRAYGNLIKSAEYLDRAFRDLVLYPSGHPYQGTISTAQPHPEHNRFALVEDSTERARELALEAQAVILLDHEDDPALRIWRDRVESEFRDFAMACMADGLQPDGFDRLEKFSAAKRDMEAAARSRFSTLAVAPEMKRT
ncbi:MAG: hypothetical protein ACYDA0_13255 [Candidatus Dormibacteraceae bacterium]